VGVQDKSHLSGSTERITTAELLATVGDEAVTARTLEFWRHQGLLSKAERTGQQGKQPQWTYPVGTIDQLRALLHLRTKTKDPDLLRVGLWFDGYPIETARVRLSITATLAKTLGALNKELARRSPTSEGDWTALEQIGRSLAGKRGPNALPRYGRQRRADRERAMTLALGLVLGDERAVARLEHDGQHVERLIGLDRGRRPRGALPAWLDGPPGDGLETFAHLGSLPALIETMESATDDELAASRGLARIMLDGVLAFTRIADAFVGAENASGFGAISAFRGDPMAAVWLLAFVIAAGRSATLNEGLHTVIDSLSQRVLPVDTRARELAALDSEELANRLPELERLPFAEQVRVKRLIADYRTDAPEGDRTSVPTSALNDGPT
jgi:hypothetical protein